MDTVGLRTLGGGAAHDTGLGARTPERHNHHDLAGGNGAWGSHLGFGSYDSRSKLHCSTLLWAAVLFFGSLVLARRLPIKAAENLEQRVPGVPSSPFESKEVPR
jgi:hypothetical protein